MASEIQIIPKFQHPHVETFVYDNTEFAENPFQQVDESVNFIAIFRSSKGIDNKLVKKTSLSDFVNTFGKSNPKKYGQPLMMPIAELNTGIACVHAMRIMPTDAAYANAAVTAYYKPDFDNKQFMIKFKAKSFSGDSEVLQPDDLEVYANMLTPIEELDGWVEVPIMTFRSVGRGEYGQTLRWRISPNTDYERDYQKKFYTFEILSTENGLSREAAYVGMTISPTDLEQAVQLNDVIGSYNPGEYPVDVVINEDNVEEIYNAYAEFLKGIALADPTLEVTIPSLGEFDIFFGNEVANSSKIVPYDYYRIITTIDDPDVCDLSNAMGNEMAGGTEGSFEGDPDSLSDIITQEYIRAFNGVTDPAILSPRRIPCDALLDANYPYDVKKALATLTLARNDCICYMDMGIVDSFSGPNFINFRNSYSGIFSTREISKNPQHYDVRDYHTKKRTTVTMTYFFAQTLPNHYKNIGRHIPFVMDFASLSGHMRNSLEPIVDMWETELKEELYLNRFNYFEAVGENQYTRAVQNTAQPINSDLLEEHNMQTLFDVKRILEYDAWANAYNFTSQEDRARFKRFEEAKFDTWRGNKVDTISIDFDVNEFEAERSILHCYCAIQFRNITKRTIIEIDVNKRNFLA